MNDIPNTFILEKNRTQWSHLPFIFLPFLGLMILVGLVIVAQSYLPEQFSQVVLTLSGLGYAFYIFTLPRRMNKDKKACHRSLIFKYGKIILFDTKRNSVIVETGATNQIASPGKFHYTINTRFYSGTYRAPLITIQFTEDEAYHIGVQGCNLEWGGEIPLITKPDYLLPVDSWLALVSRLGLKNKLVKAVDTRVR